MRSVMEGLSQWLGGLGPMYRQAEENKRAQALEASRLESEALNRTFAKAAEARAGETHNQGRTRFGWEAATEAERLAGRPLRERSAQLGVDALVEQIAKFKADTAASVGGERRATELQPYELRDREAGIGVKNAQAGSLGASSALTQYELALKKAIEAVEGPRRAAMADADLAFKKAQPGLIDAQAAYYRERDKPIVTGGSASALPGASGAGRGTSYTPEPKPTNPIHGQAWNSPQGRLYYNSTVDGWDITPPAKG